MVKHPETKGANHALYLKLKDEKVAKTLEEVVPGINIDVDESGNAVGIEVLVYKQRLTN